MILKSMIICFSVLLTIPSGTTDTPTTVRPVAIGSVLTVKMKDQVGSNFRRECGINPRSTTVPSGRQPHNIDGVRTVTTHYTETTGTVTSVSENEFTLRCQTTINDHSKGPRIVTVDATVPLGAIQQNLPQNQRQWLNAQTKPALPISGRKTSSPIQFIELHSMGNTKIQVWELSKTLPKN